MVYDALNVQAHLRPLDTLPDCYPSRKRQYYMALKGLANCEEDALGASDKVYCFNHQDIPYDLRCETAERCLKNKGHAYILALHSDTFSARSYKLAWDGKEWQVACYPTEIRPVFDWLSQHRFPKRVYNWNPKHGENGRGAHKTHAGEPVSVLHCSRQHAAELMVRAIGEEGQAEKKATALTDGDVVRKYHSYHIEDERRISRKVKEKLEKLTKL